MPAKQFRPQVLIKKILTVCISLVVVFNLFVSPVAQAQLPVVDIPARADSIYDRIVKKIWDVLKENSALMWKQTQLYFGTRLAHDAAVFLASGGTGQSSFIWNWSEVKELAGAASGEFLDNLSQTYFGKSACQPNDLNAMVQIDLSARGLVNDLAGGIANVRGKVCEDICAKTAIETPAGGASDQGGVVNGLEEGLITESTAMLGQGTGADNLVEDLKVYSDDSKRLVSLINMAEDKVVNDVGLYIWDQVRYTLQGAAAGQGFDANILATLTDEEKLTKFYDCLAAGSPGLGCNVGVYARHQQRFKELVKTILNNEQLKITKYSELQAIFLGSSWDIFKDLMTGLTKKEKQGILGSLFLYVGREYKTPGDLLALTTVPEKDDAVRQVFELFRRTDQLINSGALGVEPPNVPDLSGIISLMYPGGAPFPEAQLDNLESSVELDSFIAGLPLYQAKKKLEWYLTGSTAVPKDILADTDRDHHFIERTMAFALTDDLFFQAIKVYSRQYNLAQKWGQDMKKLVDQAMQFNSCVQMCENAEMVQPKGACTLDQISSQKGFGGITGVQYGIQGSIDLGPLGTLSSGDALTGRLGVGKGRDEESTAPKAGWTAGDLKSLSEVGDAANYALGQTLEIAVKSQGVSESAQRQAELESQANDYKPKKSAISGEVKLPGGEVGARLSNAQSQIQQANNTYTGSVLAQMWGVFFNSLIEEFINKLYDKGLEPKLYGGTFNPDTKRLSYGVGVPAAEKQFIKFRNLNITTGGEGVINSQILTRMVSACDKAFTKRKFDECIFNDGWKQAIEKQMTLADAIDKKLINGDGAFGFTNFGGTEPKTQLGQGLSYSSMIILRKYRIIPSSWEAAAFWVKDSALAPKPSQPVPEKVTLTAVMDGFADKISPYYGLVNPEWVLKMPLFRCDRQGAGEEVLFEMAAADTSILANKDLEVTINRSEDYCGDTTSCIQDKPDGSGCLEFGHCTRERDFWRFPGETCDPLYITCQSFLDPEKRENAYLESTINLGENCTSQNVGCKGYLRDYSFSRFTGGIGPRIDTESDNAFTYTPNKNVTGFLDGDYIGELGLAASGTANALAVLQLRDVTKAWEDNQWMGATVYLNNNATSGTYGLISRNDNQNLYLKFWNGGPSPVVGNNYRYQIYFESEPPSTANNITANSLGLVEPHDVLPLLGGATRTQILPTLWECQSVGERCVYERLPGRKEGCILPSGKECTPWATIYLTSCTQAGVGRCYFNSLEETGCVLPGGVACTGAGAQILVSNAKKVMGASASPARFNSGHRYWCGLPGGAGCFVGEGNVLTAGPVFVPAPGVTLDEAAATGHTTIDSEKGECVVGRWDWLAGFSFTAATKTSVVAGGSPLTCSLYRAEERGLLGNFDFPATFAEPGTKRAYLTASSKACPANAAGCQLYYTVDFPSDVYNKTYTVDTASASAGQTFTYFLSLQDKEQFVKSLLARGNELASAVSSRTTFDYTEISIAELMPTGPGTMTDNSDTEHIQFIDSGVGSLPKITPVTLTAKRNYCTERDINCRRYYRSAGVGFVAGILDPKNDFCPGSCVGYSRYVEPITIIENKLQSRLDGAALGPYDRYLIPEPKLICSYQDAGCERFIESTGAAGGATLAPKTRLYLKDIRLCVKPDHKNGAGASDIDTYTIIESAASGPTSPVNVPLLKSNYINQLWYAVGSGNKRVYVLNAGAAVDVDGDGVIDPTSPLFASYNGPCINLPPTLGVDPNNWQCADTFPNQIKPNLERCLIVDASGKVVTDLANPDCREYIYFPAASAGAQRYPLPYDLPVKATLSCSAFKRGADTAGAQVYNLDPTDPLWAKDAKTGHDGEFSCRAEGDDPALNVSCREFQGPGFQTDGAISWVDFENMGASTRWVAPLTPIATSNVNGSAGEALSFVADQEHSFSLLPDLSDVNSKNVFTNKSFKLSFWIRSSAFGDPTVIGLKDSANRLDFDAYTIPTDGKWHYVVLNQLKTDFLPEAFYVGSAVDSPKIELDNITLELSSSIYLLADGLNFKTYLPSTRSISQNVPAICNSDFTTDPPSFNDTDPVPYQLNCQAFQTDRNEPVNFKSLALCPAELVGCQAVINTFNTASPRSETFTPRAAATYTPTYDQYFVPTDFIEYVVVAPEAKCELEQAACTMVGREVKDQAGRVTGFEEKYLIDDPDNYQATEAPSACLIAEDNCQVYTRKEDGSVATFKDPENSSCAWTRPDGATAAGWYKAKADGSGLEACEVYDEPIDETIDLTVPRPKGYCVEKYTNRVVLNPQTSSTAWCDPDLIGADLVLRENDQTVADNLALPPPPPPPVLKAQHTNTLSSCLDFIDDPAVDEDNLDDDGNVNTGTPDSTADPENINQGVNEPLVECLPTAGSCPVSQSQCTLFKDPLIGGLDSYYYQIADAGINSGNCGAKVSDDAGCRLFYESEGFSPAYSAEKSMNGGTLNTDCSGSCYAATPTANCCDANRLVKVIRDRSCGEWLSCNSAIVSGQQSGSTGKGESVCLERKPCDMRAPGGECMHFVSDALQEFKTNEFDDPGILSRAGHLSGYSNEGVSWYQCVGAITYIEPNLLGKACLSGAGCVQEQLLFKTGTGCAAPSLDLLDSCTNGICKEGARIGYNCARNKDCFDDDQLDYLPPLGGCQSNTSEPCSPSIYSKQGFKSLDYITQVGQIAEVANGDFEAIKFEVPKEESNPADASALVASKRPSVFPTGWTLAKCGTNNGGCALVRRYEPPDPGTSRNSDVFRGKYSLQIKENEASVKQVIANVVPGITYTVSGWLNVELGDYASGIELDEITATGTYHYDPARRCYYTGFADSSENPSHCLKAYKTNGWEYFSASLVPASLTRSLEVRLANHTGRKVLFDDIQVRPHLDVKAGKFIAPTCRLYPETSALSCTARDNQGNTTRGWRGYCIEPDPRSTDPGTTQCVNWWPIDVVIGETSVLGEVEDIGYTGQAPLYYCLESMEKPPDYRLPRLVCVCKNDVNYDNNHADRFKYEACKVVALVSDPKPGFYGLTAGDWRLGVEADNFGNGAGDASPQGYRVRMIQGHSAGAGNDEHRDLVDTKVSGLCLIDANGHFNGDGDEKDCFKGCLLVEGLSGWTEKKNLGVKAFWQGTNDEAAYGGCTWSADGNNLDVAAKNLSPVYHKIVYFIYADVSTGSSFQGKDQAGCKESGVGDSIYALYVEKTKATEAGPKDYLFPDVDPNWGGGGADHSELTGFGAATGNTARWLYNSSRLWNDDKFHEADSNPDLNNLADILVDNRPLKPGSQSYYLFDNFELITRGRLNNYTYVSETQPAPGDRFREHYIKIARIARPQQCRILAQVALDTGENKVWLSKFESGGQSLAAPLGYQKTAPMCIPFGAVPFVREPNEISMYPIDKQTKQKDSALQQVPLELYNSQNPENNDIAKLCTESHRGQGFYSCGELCPVCVGGSNSGVFCQSNDDCKGGGVCGVGGEKGLCRGYNGGAWSDDPAGTRCLWDSDCRQTSICVGGADDGKACNNSGAIGGCAGVGVCRYHNKCRNGAYPFRITDKIITYELGVSRSSLSGGLRRLQSLFAKIYKVWEWQSDTGDDANKLKERTGVRVGQYKELSTEKLNDKLDGDGSSFTSDWANKVQDISQLALSCQATQEWWRFGTYPGKSSDSQRECDNSPGCKYLNCMPDDASQAFNLNPLNDEPNEFRDYDFCRSNYSTCSSAPHCIVAGPLPANNHCAPDHNPYPNVPKIKINGLDKGDVRLEEGKRVVTLEFEMSANANQKPITTIVIDWGDDTQTAVSGIAWDTKPRIFIHTYSYYGLNTVHPSGCTYYGAGATDYACRFRPRVKIVDHWGWCNGEKLEPNGGGDLAEGSAYLSSNIKFAHGNQPESAGYSWGYYGTSCFIPQFINKCAGEDNEGGYCKDDSDCPGSTCVSQGGTDSRYGMQSWDYFPGLVEVSPPNVALRLGVDVAPTAEIRFNPATGPYYLGQDLAVEVTCRDDYSVTGCKLEQFNNACSSMIAIDEPTLTCLTELNNQLEKTCRGDVKACSASSTNCKYLAKTGASHNWSYKLLATDDNGQSYASWPGGPPCPASATKKLISVPPGGLAPTLVRYEIQSSLGEWQALNYYDGSDFYHRLFAGVNYQMRMSCDSGGDDNLTDCHQFSTSASEVAIKPAPIACVGLPNLTCTSGILPRNFDSPGKWIGGFDVVDSTHNVQVDQEVTIYSGGS